MIWVCLFFEWVWVVLRLQLAFSSWVWVVAVVYN